MTYCGHRGEGDEDSGVTHFDVWGLFSLVWEGDVLDGGGIQEYRMDRYMVEKDEEKIKDIKERNSQSAPGEKRCLYAQPNR